MSLKRTSISTPQINSLKATMQEMEFDNRWRQNSTFNFEVIGLLKKEVLSIKNELRAEIFQDVLRYIMLNYRLGARYESDVTEISEIVSYVRNFEYRHVKSPEQFGLGYWKLSYPSKEYMVDFVVPECTRRENHPVISMVLNTFQVLKNGDGVGVPHPASGLPILSDYLK